MSRAARSLWYGARLLLGCLTARALPAQAALSGSAAPASWIAPASVPGDSFVVYHARRAFDLSARPAHFVVHVSADNRYRLYLNGVGVSSGPQRSDVAHWRYETVDLAPGLRLGRNVLAAVIWNWGAARPVALHSHRTGFVVQGEGAEAAALVNTGPGWKLLVDSAYAPIVITNATVGGYYAAGPGEEVDGARYPWHWEESEYDDSAWLTIAPSQSRAPGAPLSAFDASAGSTVGAWRSRAAIGNTTG